MNNKIEALIFDMDGTLWDATASYARLWNECSHEFGWRKEISAANLYKFMGKHIHEILHEIFGDNLPFDINLYLKRLSEIEADRMPQLGGILYPGVYDGISSLCKRYKIMALSNCGAKGLKNFLTYTELTPFFTDTLTYGESPVEKSENLVNIMQRNGVASAIYIGDTQSDCNNAHAAGVPFGHVTYGFGQCADADVTFNSFNDLVDYFSKR